jgi:hypothetical protein
MRIAPPCARKEMSKSKHNASLAADCDISLVTLPEIEEAQIPPITRAEKPERLRLLLYILLRNNAGMSEMNMRTTQDDPRTVRESPPVEIAEALTIVPQPAPVRVLKKPAVTDANGTFIRIFRFVFRGPINCHRRIAEIMNKAPEENVFRANRGNSNSSNTPTIDPIRPGRSMALAVARSTLPSRK